MKTFKHNKIFSLILIITFIFCTYMPISADSIVYKKGENSSVIYQVQTALKKLGFFKEEPTGYFGEVTEKALIAFQKKYNLGTDGKLGPTTISWIEKKGKVDVHSASRSASNTRKDTYTETVIYTVQKGDTIWDIADEYNVSVKSIIETNGLNSESTLYINQSLVIPNVVKVVKTKAAEKSASKEKISTTYVVKDGDSVWSIAEDYGVNISDILAANNLTEDSILQIKQEIKIPVTQKTITEKAIIEKTIIKETVKDPEPTTEIGKDAEYLDWFGVVDQIYEKGDIATVTDVDTGKTFKVKRLYGRNHADTEPLTADDTAVIKELYGKWSWDRRAIIVSLDGHDIAASMNGMPHGGENILDNNFNGHFCIHFKGSMTHKGDNVDPTHQAAVRKAAGLN